MYRDRDIIGGGLFTLIGLGAYLIALGYNPGTALNMGPGYLPRAVAGAMVVLGLVQIIGALRNKGQRDLVDGFNWRALILILGAIVAFAVLVKPAGIIPAVSLMIVIAWFADPVRNLRHLPALLVIGNLLPILIFNVLLKMNLKLLGAF